MTKEQQSHQHQQIIQGGLWNPRHPFSGAYSEKSVESL